ncbi:MAG: Mor transcription activator family protein [Enterocloster bolteae]
MDLLDRVQMEDLDEEQRTLAGLIGIEAFRALVRNYNGTPIYIPKIESLEKPVRDELIREEFDGKNYRELALKYGLTRNLDSEYSHRESPRDTGKSRWMARYP